MTRGEFIRDSKGELMLGTNRGQQQQQQQLRFQEIITENADQLCNLFFFRRIVDHNADLSKYNVMKRYSLLLKNTSVDYES